MPVLPANPQMCSRMWNSSQAYRGVDPCTLMDRVEQRYQRTRALKISKLPEGLWQAKVDLEEKDHQAPIWECLLTIKAFHNHRYSHG